MGKDNSETDIVKTFTRVSSLFLYVNLNELYTRNGQLWLYSQKIIKTMRCLLFITWVMFNRNNSVLVYFPLRMDGNGD